MVCFIKNYIEDNKPAKKRSEQINKDNKRQIRKCMEYLQLLMSCFRSRGSAEPGA